MWRQNHTNTMLRFPHETLQPILLNHIVVVHESKNTEIKKKLRKKGAKEVKEVAEECSKKKNGDGEAEGDGSSSRSKGSESTAAKKEEENKDSSLPVVGDEPVIVKSRPQETKEEVKEINNITEVAEEEEGGRKNEKEKEEQIEQVKTVTPNKTKKKCIVQ